VIYAETTSEGRRVKPGDYAFTGGETTPQVLQHLVNGDFIVITVTIPEGLTLHQIGQRIGETGLLCDYQFDAAARGLVPQMLGLGSRGAEGFLFPATYRFSPTATPDQVVEAMLGRFYEILTPAIEERLFELGLTARQMVTMASIVEKEARVPGERPLIAGVFYNRLRLGMPLQSDPTAQYDPSGEVAHAAEAVHMPSAYNTYNIGGLPPGPIANPGLSSIMAALYPDHTDYLYFVARSDGTHIFSKSFEEHQRAIAEVRREARAITPSG
jgi:peptidoglycan lytic transglycosylase G